MTLHQFTATAEIVRRLDGRHEVHINGYVVTRPGERDDMTYEECRELIDEIERRCQEKMATLN